MQSVKDTVPVRAIFTQVLFGFLVTDGVHERLAYHSICATHNLVQFAFTENLYFS